MFFFFKFVSMDDFIFSSKIEKNKGDRDFKVRLIKFIWSKAAIDRIPSTKYSILSGQVKWKVVCIDHPRFLIWFLKVFISNKVVVIIRSREQHNLVKIYSCEIGRRLQMPLRALSLMILWVLGGPEKWHWGWLFLD